MSELTYYDQRPMLNMITTIDEARQVAIDWQSWADKGSLSYKELTQWAIYFEALAGKFDLTDEFKENGII